jgi:hypothetical protein
VIVGVSDGPPATDGDPLPLQAASDELTNATSAGPMRETRTERPCAMAHLQRNGVRRDRRPSLLYDRLEAATLGIPIAPAKQGIISLTNKASFCMLDLWL